MAPSGVSPLSVVVEMCLGLSKHRIQARPEGSLMGALPPQCPLGWAPQVTALSPPHGP